MSMNELAPLHQAIAAKFGKQHWVRFTKSLDSIVSRFSHIKFHIDEIEKIENEAGNERFARDLIKEIFKFDDIRLGNLGLRASAHTIAALQAMHSVTDITGTALVLALNPDTQWHGYMWQAKEKLKKVDPAFEELVDKLQNNYYYQYLSAATNESKHNNIVNAAFTVQLLCGLPHGYYFAQFQRFDKKTKDWVQFAPMHILTFLNSEYDRQGAIITEMLNLLERTLI